MMQTVCRHFSRADEFLWNAGRPWQVVVNAGNKLIPQKEIEVSVGIYRCRNSPSFIDNWNHVISQLGPQMCTTRMSYQGKMKGALIFWSKTPSTAGDASNTASLETPWWLNTPSTEAKGCSTHSPKQGPCMLTIIKAACWAFLFKPCATLFSH